MTIASRSVLIAALAVFAANAQVCPVSDDNSVELFDHPSFNQSSPLTKVWSSVVGSKLRLAVEEDFGGVSGYAWHTQASRVADGFISTFTVSTPGTPKGDGFAYVIQNHRITDLNGGSGAFVGSQGIPRSIAVRFDFCADRGLSSCTSQQVRIVRIDENGSESLIAGPVGVSIKGADTVVKVIYEGRVKGSSSKLFLIVGNSQLLSPTVGDLEVGLFGGRFAFFGFTASTSWDQTATIEISKWNLMLLPSDTIVYEMEAFLGKKEKKPATEWTIDYGTTKTFTLQRRDSCGELIESGFPSSVEVKSFMVLENHRDNPTLAKYGDYVANMTDNKNGSYTFSYDIPDKLSGTWEIDVSVAGVSANGFPAAVRTKKPDPPFGGFPIWAFVLLLLLILAIAAAISYVLYRLMRYRRKLKEHEESIKAGKIQAELDRLEDGTVYKVNPMVGTLGDLNEQLKANEEELARLRNRGNLGEDQNYKVEQLQKQKDKLLADMNRLKKEEQLLEASKQGSTNLPKQKKARRKQFGQQKV